MDRLDENVKEEADGIHNSLGKNTLEHILQDLGDFSRSHCGKHDGVPTEFQCRCV